MFIVQVVPYHVVEYNLLVDLKLLIVFWYSIPSKRLRQLLN